MALQDDVANEGKIRSANSRHAKVYERPRCVAVLFSVDWSDLLKLFVHSTICRCIFIFP